MADTMVRTYGDIFGAIAILRPIAKMHSKIDGKKNSIVPRYPSFPLEDSKSYPSNLPVSESGFGNMYSNVEHLELFFQVSLEFSPHQNIHAVLLAPLSCALTLSDTRATCLQ